MATVIPTPIDTKRSTAEDTLQQKSREAGVVSGGHLLVAHVDDADTFIDAAVVDVDDVSTTKREDRVDALILQRLGDQVAARDNTRVPALLLEGVLGGAALGVDRCRYYGSHLASNSTQILTRTLRAASWTRHDSAE